jgi:methylmalonyl-CoA mutase cobalamin-binding subunit
MRPMGSGLPPPELEDNQIAEVASSAAMKIVLARDALKKHDPTADFVTDACATVGIAYHRAAGVYTMDKEMQELGTAAVHILTIATSYMRAHNE